MATDEVTGPRIYVVDDEPANLRLLEAILRRSGLESVRSFEDGPAFIAAMDEAPPDLVLLDLRMPGMDGYEVLAAIAERVSAEDYLPVLVLTADANRDARRRALSSGANDFLTKPFDPTEVELRVRNLLRTRQLHVELQARNLDLSDRAETSARTLATREREWAVQASALARLSAADTPEATAQAVCDEIGSLPGMSSVMVVAVNARGDAIPIARNSLADMRITLNRALPPATTDRWRARLAAGPWVGPWEPLFGAPLRRFPVDEPTAIAAVPLRAAAVGIGALIVSSAEPDGTTFLAARLPMLESFAAVASAMLGPAFTERREQRVSRASLDDLIARRAFHPVFQPIVELGSGRPIGYEALTRFDDGVPPDRRFADAVALGVGPDLEVACLTAAIQASTALPGAGFLSLNVSPGLLLDPDRLGSCVGATTRPIVFEVTEHVAIDDYPAFRTATTNLGPQFRFAVDDAGAGFSSFRHIVELRPDFVKLDIGLVREIDRDPIRQALVAGIVYFAQRSGCALIAEGVERAEERDLLRSLDVAFGQGYLFGHPAAAQVLAA